jgi:hypothetical protein
MRSQSNTFFLYVVTEQCKGIEIADSEIVTPLRQTQVFDCLNQEELLIHL